MRLIEFCEAVNSFHRKNDKEIRQLILFRVLLPFSFLSSLHFVLYSKYATDMKVFPVTKVTFPSGV
jgi:hypothetical protein